MRDCREHDRNDENHYGGNQCCDQHEVDLDEHEALAKVNAVAYLALLW